MLSIRHRLHAKHSESSFLAARRKDRRSTGSSSGESIAHARHDHVPKYALHHRSTPSPLTLCCTSQPCCVHRFRLCMRRHYLAVATGADPKRPESLGSMCFQVHQPLLPWHASASAGHLPPPPGRVAGGAGALGCARGAAAAAGGGACRRAVITDSCGSGCRQRQPQQRSRPAGTSWRRSSSCRRKCPSSRCKRGSIQQRYWQRRRQQRSRRAMTRWRRSSSCSEAGQLGCVCGAAAAAG